MWSMCTSITILFLVLNSREVQGTWTIILSTWLLLTWFLVLLSSRVASIPGQHGATPGIPVPPYHAIAAPQQFPQHVESWQTDWSARNQSVESPFVPQLGVQPVSAFTHQQQSVKCTPETMTTETESPTLSVSKVHDVLAQVRVELVKLYIPSLETITT